MRTIAMQVLMLFFALMLGILAITVSIMPRQGLSSTEMSSAMSSGHDPIGDILLRAGTK